MSTFLRRRCSTLRPFILTTTSTAAFLPLPFAATRGATAAATAHEPRENAEHEVAQPAWHTWLGGAAVVQFEDTDGEDDRDGGHGHGEGQVDACKNNKIEEFLYWGT